MNRSENMNSSQIQNLTRGAWYTPEVRTVLYDILFIGTTIYFIAMFGWVLYNVAKYCSEEAENRRFENKIKCDKRIVDYKFQQQKLNSQTAGAAYTLHPEAIMTEVNIISEELNNIVRLNWGTRKLPVFNLKLMWECIELKTPNKDLSKRQALNTKIDSCLHYMELLGGMAPNAYSSPDEANKGFVLHTRVAGNREILLNTKNFIRGLNDEELAAEVVKEYKMG